MCICICIRGGPARLQRDQLRRGDHRQPEEAAEGRHERAGRGAGRGDEGGHPQGGCQGL